MCVKPHSSCPNLAGTPHARELTFTHCNSMLCILTSLLSWHGPVANCHDSLKREETVRLVPVHQSYSLNVCLSIHFLASYLCNLSGLTHSSHRLSAHVHHANSQRKNSHFCCGSGFGELKKRSDCLGIHDWFYTKPCFLLGPDTI